jgi:positive regulator of sigma E activity
MGTQMAADGFKPNWTVLKWVLITLSAIVLLPPLAFLALFAALNDYAVEYYFLACCLIFLLAVTVRRFRREKTTRLQHEKSKADALRTLEREELDAARAWSKSGSTDQIFRR